MTVSSSMTGRYRLNGEIARRGSVRVMAAQDDWLRRGVAVAFCEGSQEERDAFAQHGRRVSRSCSRFLADIYDSGTLTEVPFVVFERPGANLSEILQRESLSEKASRKLGIQLVSALEALHEAGVNEAGFDPAVIGLNEVGEVRLTPWPVAPETPNTFGGSTSSAPGAAAVLSYISRPGTKSTKIGARTLRGLVSAPEVAPPLSAGASGRGRTSSVPLSNGAARVEPGPATLAVPLVVPEIRHHRRSRSIRTVSSAAAAVVIVALGAAALASMSSSPPQGAAAANGVARVGSIGKTSHLPSKSHSPIGQLTGSSAAPASGSGGHHVAPPTGPAATSGTPAAVVSAVVAPPNPSTTATPATTSTTTTTTTTTTQPSPPPLDTTTTTEPTPDPTTTTTTPTTTPDTPNVTNGDAAAPSTSNG